MPLKVRRGYAPDEPVANTPLGYINLNLNPSMFGADIGSALRNMGQVAANWEQKKESTEYSDALVDWSNRTLALDQNLTEMQRAQSAEGVEAGDLYAPRAELVDGAVDTFLGGLSENVRRRMAPTVTAQGNRFKAGEFATSLEQADLRQADNITKLTNAQLVAVERDPGQLEMAQATVDEALSASTLSQEQQYAIRKTAYENLKAVALGTAKADEYLRNDDWVDQSTFPGQVQSTGGQTNPTNFLRMEPEVQEAFTGISSQFGRPLQMTPHGGKNARTSGTPHHPSGRAGDFSTAGYSDEDKSRLVAIAVANRVQGVGGYSWGVHFDYSKRADAKGPGGLGTWFDLKDGERVGVDDPRVPAWFREGVQHGLRARNEGIGLGSLKQNSFADIAIYTDKVMATEGRGSPGVKGNSVDGLGGFTTGTWMDFMQERHPDQVMVLGDKVEAFRNNPAYAKEAVQWYAKKTAHAMRQAGQPVNYATLYLGHHFGQDGALRLLRANPNTPIEEVLGAKVVAQNPHLKGYTAEDTLTYVANKMGQQTVSSGVEDDPRYAGIPFAKRQQILADVQHWAQQQQAAQDRAQDEANAQRYADAFTVLQTGQDRNPYQTFSQGVSEGWLGTKERRSAFLNEIQRQQGDAELVAIGRGFVDGSLLYNANDEKHRSAMNKLGQPMADYIQTNSPAAIQSLGQMAQQFNHIPAVASGALIAKMNSQKPEDQVWAYDMAHNLRQQYPGVMEGALGSDMFQRLNMYAAGVENNLPTEQILESINPKNWLEGATYQGRVDEAQTLLREGEYGDMQLIGDLVNQTTSVIPFASSQTYQDLGNSAKRLKLDYDNLFTHYFTRTGNGDAAHKASIDHLKEMWGYSTAQGGVMKRPVERYADSYNGSHDWVDTHTRELLDIPEDAQLKFFADEQTERELITSSSAVNAQGEREAKPARPSWQVFTVSPEGLVDIVIDPETGRPARVNFVKNDAMIRLEAERAQEEVAPQPETQSTFRQELEERRRRGLGSEPVGGESMGQTDAMREMQQQRMADEEAVRGKLPAFKTGQLTPQGRPIWRDAETGEFYSEKTVTFELEKGSWVTFPSVDDLGLTMPQFTIENYVKRFGPVDPITGERWPIFDSKDEAEAFAKERSNTRRD